MVLVIVLFVVVILSLSAYTFTELMLTHLDAARHGARNTQARVLVDSGVDTLKMLLLQGEQALAEAGGLYDNPLQFQGVVVVPDTEAVERGAFTVIAPRLDDMGSIGGVRYGLEDESTRLNLHFLLVADRLIENGGRSLLMSLPGMTEDVADSILDWIDEDEEPREYGCEAEYYGMLQPPYAPKNAALDTVEELLLVRGVTPALLFGYDTNRNGVLDAHEQSQSGLQTMGSGTSLGLTSDPAMMDMVRGWAPYLTLYSAEKNVTSSGLPRINLNQEDMQTLYDELTAVMSEEWATFIVAYRQSGPFTGEGEAGSASGELDLTQPGQARLTQVLDLIGAKVQARFQGEQEPVVLESPFAANSLAMLSYLPILMDNCTINPSSSIPGRININQAPRAVLAGIPGLTPELVDQILQTRVPVPDPTQESAFLHETWLLTEGLLVNEAGEMDLAMMKQLSPFINAGGDVYRAQIVGYYQGAGAAARGEVVIDNTPAVPRVVFWRDLSHLGRGYPLEVLGLNFADQF